MDDFILRALLAGLLIVIVTGPLGCVVVWRRMAYFGDTLAHSALLGTALALMFDMSPVVGVVMLGLVLSVMLMVLQGNVKLSADTLLGILAHGSLATGLVVFAAMQNQGMRVDLMAYLFGDILAVSWTDLLWMLAGVVLVLISMGYMWRSLLALSVHEELAISEGVRVNAVRLSFMLLMALVVAVAMKLVGILLITALLIVPAATARLFARSPETMAVFAIVMGMLSVFLGLAMSMYWDTPAGPSVVVMSVVLFFVSRLRAKWA